MFLFPFFVPVSIKLYQSETVLDFLHRCRREVLYAGSVRPSIRPWNVRGPLSQATAMKKPRRNRRLLCVTIMVYHLNTVNYCG